MLDKLDSFDFDQFLKENKRPNYVHLVLPGAVVAGQIDAVTQETIRLGDVTVSAGLKVIEIAFLVVPRERILAWGRHPNQNLQSPQN